MRAVTKVVLWDFDGTLARRPGMWSGALVDALRSVQPDSDLSAEDLRPYVRGRFPWHQPEVIREPSGAADWWAALRPTFASAYRSVGVPAEPAAIAVERIAAHYYRWESWEQIDGAAEALQLTAEAGYRNAILSNHGPELPQLVSALGLGAAVDRVFTSAAIGAEKPNPLIFEHALTALGVGDERREDIWMVGDNPVADVEGARSVGLQTILADGAYSDARGVSVLEAAQQVVSQMAD